MFARRSQLDKEDDRMKRKGFESEHAANEFAAKVGGTVRFSPLPDYNGMIPYWTVEWEEQK